MEEYLQMKVKRLSNPDGPRMPHSFLSIVFPMDMFKGFPLHGNFLSWSVPLLKTRTHHSYFPFYCNSQEKQFWKGILGRKSHCIMIRGKFGPCQTSVIVFVQNKSTAKKALPIFAKTSIIDAWLGPKCTSDDNCC